MIDTISMANETKTFLSQAQQNDSTKAVTTTTVYEDGSISTTNHSMNRTVRTP